VLPRYGTTGIRDSQFEEAGIGSLSHPETDRWIARVILFRRMRALCDPDIKELEMVRLPAYEALFELGKRMLPHMSGDDPYLPIETQLSKSQRRVDLLWVDSISETTARCSSWVCMAGL
jgi:hypothetical protein